ncbi:regulator of microtubule dynamics protein 1-like isoform X2 [Pleurodeles waltl]|uniref:regulator of microtubule dynamics protein 1-like isoform X2 n=1 Tax=Pleurodeles waltl TaxID=8319 RepID=UPI0037095669
MSTVLRMLRQWRGSRVFYHTLSRLQTVKSRRAAPSTATVLRQSIYFRRGFVLSSLMYLGYEAYQGLSEFAVVHASVSVQDIQEQADYLYGAGETEKLYIFLSEHKNCENGELLWRLARAAHDYSLLSTKPAEKKRLVYEAIDFAKKALDKDPSNFAAHKKAIELNNKDATTIHLLGLWSYFVAEMPWAQRKIASVLFTTPPTSTFEKALKLFERAEEVSPNFYSKNLLFLGKTFLKLKNKEKAIAWLLKAKQVTARTEEDKEVIKEATGLLNSLGIK